MCGDQSSFAGGTQTGKSPQEHGSESAELAGDLGDEICEEFRDGGHAAADYADDDFGVAAD